MPPKLALLCRRANALKIVKAWRAFATLPTGDGRLSDARDDGHVGLINTENAPPDLQHGAHANPYTDLGKDGQAEIINRIGDKAALLLSAEMTDPDVPPNHPYLTANMIRAIMLRTGWKQAVLAEQLDTSQSQISRWLNGASATWDDGIRIKALAEREDALTNGTRTNTMGPRVMVEMRLTKEGRLMPPEAGREMQVATVPFPIPHDRFALEVDAEASAQRARTGDLIIVGPATIEIAKFIGREVAASLGAVHWFFGVLVAGRRTGTFSLVGGKGFVLEDADVKEIAPYCATVAEGEWRFEK